MSVIIYSTQHGGNGGPGAQRAGHDHAGHVVRHRDLGYIGYRWATRGERGSRIDALTTIAGSE